MQPQLLGHCDSRYPGRPHALHRRALDRTREYAPLLIRYRTLHSRSPRPCEGVHQIGGRSQRTVALRHHTRLRLRRPGPPPGRLLDHPIRPADPTPFHRRTSLTKS
jgi:hypothetical protein